MESQGELIVQIIIQIVVLVVVVVIIIFITTTNAWSIMVFNHASANKWRFSLSNDDKCNVGNS